MKPLILALFILLLILSIGMVGCSKKGDDLCKKIALQDYKMVSTCQSEELTDGSYKCWCFEIIVHESSYSYGERTNTFFTKVSP